MSGDFDTLKLRQVEMQVGGSTQFIANDPATDAAAVDGHHCQLYLQPGSNTGQPSAANPITLRYYYWNGWALTDGGTLIATGVGQTDPIILPDNGDDVSTFLASAVFDANNLTTFAGTPVGDQPPVAGDGLTMDIYADRTVPTATTPVNATYTPRDDLGHRRFGDLTFVETSSHGAWTVPLQSAPISVASNVSTIPWATASTNSISTTPPSPAPLAPPTPWPCATAIGTTGPEWTPAPSTSPEPARRTRCNWRPSTPARTCTSSWPTEPTTAPS